jgi:hypothetical protein
MVAWQQVRQSYAPGAVPTAVPRTLVCIDMNQSGSGAADNLTGVWNGVFQQPHFGSVAFTATLIESANQISGSTHERCALFGCPRGTHLALLSGRRQSRTVSFVKTYDPPGFGYGSVSYVGELNGDATEIAGTWTIEGLSGAFLMIRARRRTLARRRKKHATV